MEQIELVVKVPKDYYETLKMMFKNYEFSQPARVAIVKGIPLPKGHDALVDKKNVIDAIDWYRLNPQHFSIDNVIDDIKCMEFLVEADKEGAEECL